MPAITPTLLSSAFAAADRAEVLRFSAPERLSSLLLLPISPATIESLCCHGLILRLLFGSFLVAVGLWISSCAAALGPGYSIEKQEIRVQFDPGPDPRIRVDSDYQLRNTGNQPLSSLEVRLSGRRRFRIAESRATWDGASLTEQNVAGNSAEHLADSASILESWRAAQSPSLRGISNFRGRRDGIPFCIRCIFSALPRLGAGVAALAGIVRHRRSSSREVALAGPCARWISCAHQRPLHKDVSPRPEITGSVRATSRGSLSICHRGPLQANASRHRCGTRFFSGRAAQEEARSLQQSADAMVLAIRAYDTTFGTRSRKSQPFWIVECPVVLGCFTAAASSYANLLSAEPGAVSSELASARYLDDRFERRSAKLAAAAPGAGRQLARLRPEPRLL